MSETRLDYRSHVERETSNAVKIALVVGFLALAAAIVRAHQVPATGYELSPYAATPPGFWLGVGAALLVSIAVVATGYRDAFAGLALTLGGGSILAVVSLPVVRGYHYYGAADSLTHLGWARELLAASLSPFELVYPAGHLFGGAASTLVGIDARHALMLAVPTFVLVYFVFSILTVRAIVPEPGAAVAGGFVAFLLLPVFNVGSSLMFISFTLGLLFTPVLLYLFVLYTGRGSRQIIGPVNELDAAILFAGVGLLLLHPQVFSDLLVLLGGMAFLQVINRISPKETPIDGHRPVFGQFAVLSGLFVVWNANHPVATRTVQQIIDSLTGSGELGAIVQQRGASLTEIGAGLPILFVKMFLVNAIVALFAGWVILRTLRGGNEAHERLGSWVRYYLVGGLLLAVYAVLHFFGQTSEYFFRHLGFAMVLVSILGAIGIFLAGGLVVQAIPWPAPFDRGVAAIGVLAGILALVLSLAVVFPSPYIYSPSHHVTESTMEGYEASFEHRADGVRYAGIRGGADRYSDALLGPPELYGEEIYGEEIRSGLPSTFESDRYLVVTEIDRKRETGAYRGLRVTRDDFEGIGTTVGVSQVMSNGDARVYYVDGG